jgi:Icc protein
VLHTGDVAYDPHEPAYERAREILGCIRWPVHYIPGNHDSAEMLQRVFLKRDTVQPAWPHSFEINGVQVVLLDSTGPAEPPSGTVSDEQLTWLRGITEAVDPRPLVIGVHHNALATGVPWLDTFMRMANGDDLHATLLPARHRIRGVFYGHIHQNTQTLRDGILYSSVLSSWYQIHAWPGQTETVLELDAEPGFNVVTITADQTYIRHHRYRI